jgi:hypothetical protein
MTKDCRAGEDCLVACAENDQGREDCGRFHAGEGRQADSYGFRHEDCGRGLRRK